MKRCLDSSLKTCPSALYWSETLWQMAATTPTQPQQQSTETGQETNSEPVMVNPGLTPGGDIYPLPGRNGTNDDIQTPAPDPEPVSVGNMSAPWNTTMPHMEVSMPPPSVIDRFLTDCPGIDSFDFITHGEYLIW